MQRGTEQLTTRAGGRGESRALAALGLRTLSVQAVRRERPLQRCPRPEPSPHLTGPWFTPAHHSLAM